ncbi:hypothetical protein FQA39_LY04862 [Lamprigera yunnana]|nr:hypothetical protein FQA39_LY04862 [Lamprigera yunnana]
MPSVDWDPLEDSEKGTLTSTASARIKRDLMSLFTDPPPGLFVVGDEHNLKIVHAIIFGVMDTPYEGGFFYFILKCPNDYPINPPKVKLMTTDAGNIRTWEGPSWSPAQHLSSVLLSIQSLLNENPYFNEPGLLKEQVPGDSKRYNDFIRHETIRVSVCGMIENECRLNIPEQLKDIMEKTFIEFYDQYVEIIKKNLHLDGTKFIDPFKKGTYGCQYKSLLVKMEKLRAKLFEKNSHLKEPCNEVRLASTIT